MPRLPKWLLMKEWLTYDDVLKVSENSASELENILARDESEEFARSYKFVCTFAPRECQKEVKEYRFEQNARQSMRAHVKEHIKLLKANASLDKESEFLTRNQLFQQSKGHKHKLPVNKTEAPVKRPKTLKPDDTDRSERELVQKKPKSKRQRKHNKFTELKQPSFDRGKQPSVERENFQHTASTSMKEEVPDNSDVILQPAVDEIKYEIPVLKEDLTPDIQNELVDLHLEEQEHETELYDEDDDDASDKTSSETQTDKEKKEMETTQYRIVTKLFSLDRTQWSNMDKTVDDFIVMENATEEISQDDKEKIKEAMKQWMNSVRLYNCRAIENLQDPLSPTEESMLASLTPQDWKRLETADDSESKLRLTVYARILLRDYVWYPRKLKPKVCKHCQRHYTASTSLYSHLVSLSGIRFWVCSKCKDSNREEATFTRKHSLQYHILKEIGIPRYRCSEPGCSKTHNHTHHQKSHARQHTGEQYYKCEVPGCKVRFSNRNTYSRHLLQNHSTELTSANELRAIDKTEAQMKVHAARLRARERSKSKRQQSQEGAAKEQNVDKMAMQDRSVNQLMASEAKSNDFEGDASSLEKYMKPSASQLLYGIARDVRRTTSAIGENGKPTDNMLGGLDLLATVSKYMNAENCDDDQWKSENYKERKIKPSNVKNDSKAINQASDIKPSSTIPNKSFVPALAALPAQISSDQLLGNGGQTDNAAPYYKAVYTGDVNVKVPSSNVVSPTSQHTIIVSPGSREATSLPYQVQCALNAIKEDKGGGNALNIQLPAKKLVLNTPSGITNASPAHKQRAAISSSDSLLKQNEKRDKQSTGNGVTNAGKSQELNSSPSLFSDVKTFPLVSSNMTAVKSTSHENETASFIKNEKNDNGALQPKIISSNTQLQLRSISSVSGKTYIILASSPKGNFVNALQPYFKESDSKTANKAGVGASAITLS